MKRCFTLLISTLFFSVSYAQKDNTTLFLKQVLPNLVQVYQKEMGVLKQEYTDRYFGPVAGQINLKKGKQSYEHVIQFTANEKEYIRSEFAKMQTGSWSKELFTNSKMMTRESIFKILSDNEGWKFFEKNYGSRIYSFSKPIFLRQDKFVLFYVEYGCGDKCGEGSLAVYQKKDNYWVPVATISSWIS